MSGVLKSDVLTTGQVAELCHVSSRTVARWFDSGELEGFVIPGSRERRIPAGKLTSFMRAHGIDMAMLTGPVHRILVVAPDVSQNLLDDLAGRDGLDVRQACNEYEAGLLSAEFTPRVLVLHVEDDLDTAAEICRNIKTTDHTMAASVIAAINIDKWHPRAVIARGFDECLPLPYSPDELVAAIHRVTDILS